MVLEPSSILEEHQTLRRSRSNQQEKQKLRKQKPKNNKQHQEFPHEPPNLQEVEMTQPAFACPKLTTEALEQGVKYVQS